MSRLPGVYSHDVETSAIPTMPGERIVCIVGQFINGPLDRPFYIDKAELYRYSPMSTISEKPDFEFMCLSQTLKAASRVMIVRVADSASALVGKGTDGTLLNVETRYPTEKFNGKKVDFSKGKFLNEIIVTFNGKNYNMSSNKEDSNYILNINKFCPDLVFSNYVAPAPEVKEVTTKEVTEESAPVTKTTKTASVDKTSKASSSALEDLLDGTSITIDKGNSGYMANPDVTAFKASIDLLGDVDSYDPFLIMSPGVTDISIQKALSDLTITRSGDCKVMLDLPNSADVSELAGHLSTINNMYVEAVYGWGVVYDDFLKRDVQAPPSIGYGKAFLVAQNKSEYGSVAGKTRGVIDVFNDLVINYTPSQKLELQDARLNPVIDRKGLIQIYNNMTLIRTNSVFADTNVTNCHIAIKKAVLATSDDYVFEGNRADTWNKWVTAVTPILDSVKANNGVYDYRILMGETDGTVTATDIDTGRMPGIIKYKPTREVKWIDVYFNAYSYGIEFDS